jgi:hypothetical protein
MVSTLLGPILALLVALTPGSSPASPLQQRSAAWPAWSLPAPLQRPGQQDLIYPDWFLGDWQVEASDGSRFAVRFQRDRRGRVVGDRAGNALAVGRAVLGDRLQAVRNDPTNPNRQLARLHGSSPGVVLQLESTVVGRRREPTGDGELWVDELALQVLHGPGDPAVSQVEVLTHFRRQGGERIEAEQWQASYPSPGAGLNAAARSSSRLSLRLDRLPPGSDRAS